MCKELSEKVPPADIIGKMGTTKQRRIISAVLVLFIPVLIAGCQPSIQDEPALRTASFERIQSSPRLAFGRQHIAGWSVLGRPIRYEVIGYTGETILIMATIHGNEPAGTKLLQSLSLKLKRNPEVIEGKRIVLIPIANPDGYYRNTRENARGIDLNRNFPASNRQNNNTYGRTALSEPESQALYKLIQSYQPDRIISIHQPLDCIDYDGPAGSLAEAMSRYCDIPVKKLGARYGSMGASIGEGMDIPIITFELPAGEERLDRNTLWQKYGNACLAAITYPDDIPVFAK